MECKLWTQNQNILTGKHITAFNYLIFKMFLNVNRFNFFFAR